MKDLANSNIYRFIAAAAQAAAVELVKRQTKSLQVSFKPDTSLVTEADLASERIILGRIRDAYPEDLIFSEEAGIDPRARRPGAHLWIVDPLDGTTNYANGYPFYCISIARGRFREDGAIDIMAGCVMDPCRAKLYYAERGRGAWVNGESLKVAPGRDFAKCFLVTGFYYMKGADLQVEIERFARVAQACQSIRRDGAAALDLALVAEGVFDAFWEHGLQPWDVAAGSLLVAEAGGQVRNYVQTKGRDDYDVEGDGLLAGSGSAVRTIAGLL